MQNESHTKFSLRAMVVACGLFTLTLVAAGCGGKCGGFVPCVAPFLSSIQITPNNGSVAVGSTQQFKATGTFSDGNTRDVTSTVTWSSSDTSLATITSSGLATAVSVGRPQITATAPLASASTRLIVVVGTTAQVPRFAYAANNVDGTISEYTVNSATGQLRANGYVLAGKGPTAVAVDPRVIQPYPAVANSNIDFVDLHAYPVIAGLTLQQYVQNFGMTGFARQPVIMGEFGAEATVYSSSDTAAVALQAWQVGSCPFGFQGWMLWTWDTSEQFDFPHWYALSGDGAVNQALGPATRPDPCK